MSSSPRPATAPSGDSRISNIAQTRNTSYVHWNPTRGERSEPSAGDSSSSPITSDDRHLATTFPTISAVEAQSEGDGTRLSGNAVTPHAPLPTAAEDPWLRKTLLTLDGGGIRGYSSLLILRELMNRIAALEQNEEPRADCSVAPLKYRAIRRAAQSVTTGTNGIQVSSKPESQVCSRFLPCHYFDFVAGTSTGGLIAIMLGRLSMTVDECIQAYENLADRVFGHPRHFHIRNPPWIPRDKYNHKLLETVIKDIVKQRSPTGTVSEPFQQPNEDTCRTIAIAWQKISVKGTRVPYLMRSYRHPKSRTSVSLERNPGVGYNHLIWQVARATSAAPLYFKAFNLEEEDGDEKSELIDGGFGANNPTEEAYRSVRQFYGNNAKAVSVLVSVGTGKNLEHGHNPKGGYRLYLKYANAAAKWATDSEKTHETVTDLTQGNAEYFRLNVEHGIGKMKLDEWKGKKGSNTLELIRSKTEVYLSTPEAQRHLDSSAQRLVEIRRRRSARTDSDRWERFCHGVEYACCQDNCPTGGNRYREMRELRSHIDNMHSHIDEAMLEALLIEGKCYPMYEETP